MALDAKIVSWIYLITRGSVVGKWDYHLADFEPSLDQTWNCLDKIQSCGVNWKKTKEPFNQEEDSFYATDSDFSEKTETLQGSLVMNDGSIYQWGTNLDDSRRAGRVLEILEFMINKVSQDKTFEENVKALRGEG